MNKLKGIAKTPIKHGKVIFIAVSLLILIVMVIFIFSKFYVKVSVCERRSYLYLTHNESNLEKIEVDDFYSNITIPKDKSFCIGVIENRSVYDKTYNITYPDAFCNGTTLRSGKTYDVYCSNEVNKSVTVCSVLLNCVRKRVWKIK